MVLLLSIGAPFPFHPALPKLFHCSITVSKQTIHPGHFDRPSFKKKHPEAAAKIKDQSALGKIHHSLWAS